MSKNIVAKYVVLTFGSLVRNYDYKDVYKVQKIEFLYQAVHIKALTLRYTNGGIVCSATGEKKHY